MGRGITVVVSCFEEETFFQDEYTTSLQSCGNPVLPFITTYQGKGSTLPSQI